jgi:NADH-quinone oxidoreductase subunit J
MLLDLRASPKRKTNVPTVAGGILIAVIFVAQLLQVLAAFPAGKRTLPTLAHGVDDVKSVGHLLFSSYNLPFQVVAVLVLVATIGVVVLSKRELE